MIVTEIQVMEAGKSAHSGLVAIAAAE